MTERVAARLRPDCETVRLLPHGNLRHLSGRGIEDVDDVVITSGEPELLAIGADVAHVRASATGNRPIGLNPARSEIDDGDATLAARRAVHMIRAAVGDVELSPVPARVETVRSLSGLDEIDLPEGLAVDHEDRRVVRLALTAEGHAIAARMPAVFTSVTEKLLSGFSPEETGFLKSLLRRVLANSCEAFSENRDTASNTDSKS